MAPFKDFVGKGLGHVSISEPDKLLSNEEFELGYIARNPKNHADMWYVSKKYFDDNLEPVVDGASIGLTFGQAIEAVKEGKCVARAGWNGKGMFIFQRPSDELEIGFIVDKVKSLPQSVKDFFKAKIKKEMPSEQGLEGVKFNPYLCMYAADGSIVNGWLASQTDILSEDWTILEN